MKAYGGVNVQTHVFLTSALVGDEWSASRTCRFNPQGKSPRYHWIGGWVEPTISLVDMEKLKFLTLPGLELRACVFLWLPWELHGLAARWCTSGCTSYCCSCYYYYYYYYYSAELPTAKMHIYYESSVSNVLYAQLDRCFLSKLSMRRTPI
jgi:hypothetical protein